MAVVHSYSHSQHTLATVWEYFNCDQWFWLCYQHCYGCWGVIARVRNSEDQRLCWICLICWEAPLMRLQTWVIIRMVSYQQDHHHHHHHQDHQMDANLWCWCQPGLISGTCNLRLWGSDEQEKLYFIRDRRFWTKIDMIEETECQPGLFVSQPETEIEKKSLTTVALTEDSWSDFTISCIFSPRMLTFTRSCSSNYTWTLSKCMLAAMNAELSVFSLGNNCVFSLLSYLKLAVSLELNKTYGCLSLQLQQLVNCPVAAMTSKCHHINPLLIFCL